MEPRQDDLQERLEASAARVVRYVHRMPHTMSGDHFAGQLLPSGCSPPFHYGRSQPAGSNAVLIHKCRSAQKEQKGSRSNMNVLYLYELMPGTDPGLIWSRQECEEPVRILGKIISNAKARGDRWPTSVPLAL